MTDPISFTVQSDSLVFVLQVCIIISMIKGLLVKFSETLISVPFTQLSRDLNSWWTCT